MYDLHSHLLPGIDDGAPDLATALTMARLAVAGGVKVQACTPHILPGVYNNSGPQIRLAVARLQEALDQEGIALRLVAGADVHLVPDVVGGLRSGHLLTLADSRYVLIEPPHHVPPARLVEMFFNILVAGFQPILTHPERLAWIRPNYGLIEQLATGGVWMQLTASSLLGAFGREPKYWSERMLNEGKAHILASDCHDAGRRPPNLLEGFSHASAALGETEAKHLVVTRPLCVLANQAPNMVPPPLANGVRPEFLDDSERVGANRQAGLPDGPRGSDGSGIGLRGWLGRVRQLVRGSE